jgi:hypothetical protein
MKTLLNCALLAGVLFLNSGAGCFNKNSDPQPSGHCKKIVVSEDGDETEYEFDKVSKLLSIDGKSVADYYTKNTFEISYKLGDETVVPIAFKNNLWRQKIVDATGDGFRIYYSPEVVSGETKIVLKTILGAAEGDDSFRNEVKFSYDTNGNCMAETGSVLIDGETLLFHETTYKYATDKVAPFVKHPFQWFLELPWAEGHTNKNLAQSAYFVVANFDDQGNLYGNDENRIERWGDITYSYSHDSNGRLSRIQIDKVENEKITHLPTGRIQKKTEKKQKVVTLVYEC